MGRVSDEFCTLIFDNEADVSLKFTVPLLNAFLGFSKNEIVPEHDFPARTLFFGRRSFSSKSFPKSQRPDFVICLDGDLEKACFVVDSKGPTENLDEHLDQLKSYSSGARVNFLVITNGKDLTIYFGQEEVLKLSGLNEIDVFFAQVKQLLSKDSHSRKKPLELIRDLDLKEIGDIRKIISDTAKQKIRVELSDYFGYITRLHTELADWHNANTFTEHLGVSKVIPPELHTLRTINVNKENYKEKTFDSNEVLRNETGLKIITGQSGIGKTTLLRYWTFILASKCLDAVDSAIPIFVQLRNYGLNRNIKDLILNSLNKRGYACSIDALTNDFLKKNFVLFLDGFDEIAQIYQNDALSEIAEFANTFPRQKLIISSRTGQQPFIGGSLNFEILPLGLDKIDLIVESTLGPRKLEFLNQLSQLGLINEMSNTLLLLLTIGVFRSQGKIPVTRAKIIDNSIIGFERWAESKSPEMQTRVAWKAKLDILERIAYAVKQKEYGSAVSESGFSPLLLESMGILEKQREIPSGLEKAVVIKELSNTGFVHVDEYGLSFCSTMFLDYFAAVELSKLYTKDKTVLSDKLDKVIWHEVIVIAASKLQDANEYVSDICRRQNTLKAAACAIENNHINNALLKAIARDLEQLCTSRFPTVRYRALYYLGHFERKLAREIFQRLADSSYPSVKMIAIQELSKEADILAVTKVNENIDWNEGGFEIGRTSQGMLAIALANLGDEDSHLNIIDIWKRNHDIFTAEDCRKAMLQLVYESKLTGRIRDSLLSYFLSEPSEKDVGLAHKIRGIADVFIALGDDSIAQKLIQSLNDKDIDFFRRLETSRILASLKSLTIFQSLVEECQNTQMPPLVRQAMIEAVVQSKYFRVELPVLEKLLGDYVRNVKRAAVKGLSKYASYEVKDILLRLIDDVDVGDEATSLLGDFGLLSLLAEQNRFPKIFFPEALFEQIRKHGLKEFLPRLNKLKERWLADKHSNKNELFLIDLAHTYFILGEREQALQVISSFRKDHKYSFQDGYNFSRLMDLCPILGQRDGLGILTDLYQTVESIRKTDNHPNLFDGIFMDDRYLENLEKIGGDQVVEKLTLFCDQHCNDNMLFERAMRSIVLLSPKSREDWLINLLENHPQLKGANLHRAIEALGVIGTEKAIPLIRQLATKNIESEYISDTCLIAIERIYYQKGIIRFLRDEDILPQPQLQHS